LLPSHLLLLFFFLSLLRPPSSTLFPYTTLFRSLSASGARRRGPGVFFLTLPLTNPRQHLTCLTRHSPRPTEWAWIQPEAGETQADRKSTRLNSSHVAISYAVFCLKKKKKVKSYT